MGDAGYIGEEMLDNTPEGILEQRCYCIYQSVREDYFSLDEALAAYQVSREDYEDFVEKKLLLF